MKLKKITALVMAAAMGLSLTACGGSGAAGGSGSPAASQPAAPAQQETPAPGETQAAIGGGVETVEAGIGSIAGDADALATEMVMPTSSSKDSISILLAADPGSLDPFTTGGGSNAEQIYYQICEPLFQFGYNNEIYPLLAESWEQTDETHYTFHLRQGVKYTNGEEFTADDVIYSIGVYANHPRNKQNVKNIDLEQTKAVDDHTLEIVLTQPDAYFMTCLARCSMIKESIYDEKTFAEAPIGTGPYVIEEFIGGNSATLTANEDYWGGAPAIKHVTYKVVNDVSQRSIELETGGVDIAWELGNNDYSRIEADDRFHSMIRTGYKNNAFYFNCSENSIFQDVKVRQAVAYAIDSAAIFAATYQNKFGSLANAFMSRGMLDYDPAWEEGGYYQVDLEKAKALIAEAGIPEGTKITIISNEDKTLLSNCEIVQAMVSQIGLTAEITSYEKAVYNSILDDEASGWDMAANSFNAPSGYAADLAQAYFAWDGINRSCYKNERLEELVTQCPLIADNEERKPITDEIVKILHEDVPAYAYSCQAVNWGWVKGLKGFNIFGNQLIKVQFLYFE